jgi:DNA-binding transcriptional ArsR family regulator
MTELFRALSNVHSDRILTMLSKEAMSPRELEAKTKMKQSYLSVLMRQFLDVGLVEIVPFNKTGKRVRLGYKYYRATDKYQRIKQAI